MKRLLCLFLALLMIVFVAVSCDSNENKEDFVNTTDAALGDDTAVGTEAISETETATEKETETEEVTESVTLGAEYDLSNFKIVYSGTQNATLANSLKTKIKSATGASPSIVKATDTNEVEFELIIGNTSRDISKLCFDLAESDYITSTGILCDNGKIQILGIDKLTIANSIDYFVENVLKQGSTTISILADDIYVKEMTHEELSIPKRLDDTSIRLVTNNIAQQALNSSPGRIEGLTAAYKFYDADVCTFQEVDKGWRTDDMLYGTMAKMGYTLVEGTKGKMYSCPIFYKTERFNLIAGENVLFDLSGIALSGEARAYAWACLEDKTTGKRVIVMNTHFIAKAGADKEEHRQVCADELVEVSEQLKTKYNADGVTMSGDFNCNPSSNPYKTMASALNSAREHCPSKVNMGYKTSCGFGKAPDKAEGEAIDHVFYSKTGITAKHFETIVSKYSYAYADHVPVVFDFELN